MNRRKQKTGLIVAVLVFCAIFARVLGKSGVMPTFFGLLRTMIYIGLYVGWGMSVGRRILHKQAHRYMAGVSFLIVFWFIVRSMKYYFVADPDISRQLWYWYYLPMLFVPLFSLFVSLSLGKPENYRLPKWIKALYIPTALLLLLVLTNDFHQLVFSFPGGEVWSDLHYDYRPAYYLLVAWEVACALTAFVTMLVKCRLAQRRKYLPALLLGCALVYVVVYVSGAQWGQAIGGDITAALSLLFVGILESCIQCGLIQTNTGYEMLFEAGTFGAQIVGDDGQICASANSPLLSAQAMQAARNGTVSLDKNTLLKGNRIDGGYVFWQEDIAPIAALLEKMEENRKSISQSNHLERENCLIELRISALREKNRLYDLLQKRTERQIDLLDYLFALYHAGPDQETRRALLAKIAVIGAYIKRCGNLMFLGEKSETTDTAKLSLCIGESFANLELMGVECAMDIPENNRISVKDAIRVYDFFEKVTETAIDDLHFLWLKARVLADSIVFHLEAECDSSLASLADFCEKSFFEDGVWRFTLRVEKAGEQS